MEDSIPELLSHVAHALRQEWGADGVLDEFELSVMQSNALSFVGRQTEPTQQDLVLASGRDKGQIARVLKQLGERKLIERHADKDDRRIQRLTLTADGKRICSRLHRRRRELGKTMLAELSVEERDQLTRLLRKLRASLAS